MRNAWEKAKQEGSQQAKRDLDPAFKDLCEADCEGLPERPHEVKKCADKDIKQFYVSKQLNSEESRTKESAATAKQSVDDLEGTNVDMSSKLWL